MHNKKVIKQVNKKEFLKITKGKIILSFILIIIALISLFVIMFLSSQCKLGGECPTPSKLILDLITALFFLLIHFVALSLLITGTIRFIHTFNLNILVVVIGVFVNLCYIYLLSCLIIYFYSKRKSKT